MTDLSLDQGQFLMDSLGSYDPKAINQNMLAEIKRIFSIYGTETGIDTRGAHMEVSFHGFTIEMPRPSRDVNIIISYNPDRDWMKNGWEYQIGSTSPTKKLKTMQLS